MEIYRHNTVFEGPVEWFTGKVYVTSLGNSDNDLQVSAAHVHFTLTARTAWHSHPKGQLLYVTEGKGFVQSQGKEKVLIQAGDVIWTPPNELHWHGACPDNIMHHIAVTGVDETGNAANWRDQVTEQEYNS